MEKLLYQTHTVVHLGNIKKNIEGIRDKIKKKIGDRKILLAVKANAYGHGAIEVSKMAEKIGVEWLGVATVLEGIHLRKNGIKLPILKFSPAFCCEMEEAVKNEITLSVCEKENIDHLNNLVNSLNQQLNVHLKVDSGMGRIGVSMDEAVDLAAYIENSCDSLFLEGLFTHLPVSDTFAQNDYTNEQLKRFVELSKQIEKKIGRKIDLVHSANSGGILGHGNSHLDMVRPGIMLYGYYPDKTTPHSIKLYPGISFLTQISFVKHVKKGTSVGYGRTWIAPNDGYVATIPAGYADGFNRLFSNSGRVLVAGKSYPIIGRVCMDQSMIWLDSNTYGVKVEDKVTLIGSDGAETITTDEWADILKTITYEVTCQINPRVPKIYDRK